MSQLQVSPFHFNAYWKYDALDACELLLLCGMTALGGGGDRADLRPGPASALPHFLRPEGASASLHPPRTCSPPLMERQGERGGWRARLHPERQGRAQGALRGAGGLRGAALGSRGRPPALLLRGLTCSEAA